MTAFREAYQRSMTLISPKKGSPNKSATKSPSKIAYDLRPQSLQIHFARAPDDSWLSPSDPDMVRGKTLLESPKKDKYREQSSEKKIKIELVPVGRELI